MMESGYLKKIMTSGNIIMVKMDCTLIKNLRSLLTSSRR